MCVCENIMNLVPLFFFSFFFSLNAEYKTVWPKVLGMKGEEAKAIIEKDNPLSYLEG